jgi:uncharacterized protein
MTLFSCIRRAAVIGLLAAIPIAATAQAAASAPDSARLSLARRLLHAMQADRAIAQGIDEAMDMQRRAGGPPVPKVFMDSLIARVRRRAPEIVDSLAPLYAGALTTPDLRDLVQFYESPLGQRFAAAQAGVTGQAQQVGQRWGARVALEVMQDLVNHGIMPTDSL